MQYRKYAGWPRLSKVAAQLAAFVVLACGITTAASAATTLYVSNTPGPGEYESIGAACNAASDGDTILIKDGIYSGHDNIQIGIISNLPNVTIASVNGASHVTIDLQGSDPAFSFSSGNNSSAKLQGLTIENGNSVNSSGGVGNSVIQCATGASPVISQCVFQNNTGTYNGFTAVVYFGVNAANPTFTQCQFLNNTMPGGVGGAMYIGAGSVTISKCLFDGNSTDDPSGFGTGGAIAIGTNGSSTSVTLINDVFTNNVSGLFGAAIYEQSGDATNPTIDIENCSFNGNRFTNTGTDFTAYCSAVDGTNGNWTINNSILYGDNTTTEFGGLLSIYGGSTVSVQNSDVQGGYSGTGNIDVDPLFLTPGFDLRLFATSPAINAGAINPTSPTVDILGRPRDSQIDMGAYEFAITSAPVAIGTINLPSTFSGPVTVFSDNSGKVSPPTSYSASIDWGDGTASAGTISQIGGTSTNYVVAGTHTYTTGGSKTVTVTITANNPSGSPVTSVATTSANVIDNAPAIVSVSAPSSTAAGSPITVNFTVENSHGAPVPYSGTLHFTSSDPQAILPADVATESNTGSFQATLTTAGAQTITVTDTAISTLTGTSNSVTVTPLTINHLGVSAPGTVTAGTPFSVTVSAQDMYNNVATSYSGMMFFTTSSASNSLPSSPMLINGTGTFPVTLNTTGNQRIAVFDAATFSMFAVSGNILVQPGPTTHFSITAPATVAAGVPNDYVVAALDSQNNLTPAYSGTVHFTSTDPQSILPADIAIRDGRSSAPVTFITASSETLRVRDTVNTALTGTVTVSVTAGAATHLTITAPTTAMVGTAFNAVVTAKDAYNNTVAGYTGTIHISSTDGQAVLPANFVLTGGAKQIAIKLQTPGTQTVTATDTTNSSLTATTGNINVTTTASKLVITASTATTAGNSLTFTVTAKDVVGNTVSDYSGTVHFTSTDAQATLPADATLTNGVGTFSITFKTAATQSITVTDTVTSSIKGGISGIVVSAAAASQFAITAPSSCTSGTAFYATVTAKDTYGNLAKTYSGTVHFTSTDLAAVLPADTTLVSGTRQVIVKLKTRPSQTFSATDAANSITATSAAITVN